MTKRPLLKVCGMRDSENIKAVAALKPAYLGFIFYPKSKRYVGNIVDKQLLHDLPKSMQKVGVFVNESLSEILLQIENYGLDCIQLHGDESPQVCEALQAAKIEVIKVFSVGEQFDFQQLKPYLDCCDYFLFDTKGKERGGNGVTFNWEVLNDYPFQKPFFLSGGIDLDNIQDLKKYSHLPIHAIDVNSKFELEPALKDVKKLKELYSYLAF